MIENYEDLVEAVSVHLARSDIAVKAPLFIQLAEAKMRRNADVRKLVDVEVTIDGSEIALPADFGSIETIYYTGEGATYGELLILPNPGLLSQHMEGGVAGRPRYGAVVGSVLRVAPAPDREYAARLSYWSKPDRLGAETATNWLLDEHPDAYLYGALCEAEPYLKNDERLPMWRALFDNALAAIGSENRERQVGRMSRPSITFG